jgi:hypothetical protein
MNVRFYENNSGGRYRLTENDYTHLLDSGKWERGRSARRNVWLRTLYGNFRSVRAAQMHFKKVTGLNPNEVGCECCGRPYEFSEEPED